MNPHVAVRDVARSAADFVHKNSGARLHSDSRSDAIAIRFRADGANRDPVICVANLIHQQAGHRIHVADDRGDPAIVPEITDSQAAR